MTDCSRKWHPSTTLGTNKIDFYSTLHALFLKVIIFSCNTSVKSGFVQFSANRFFCGKCVPQVVIMLCSKFGSCKFMIISNILYKSRTVPVWKFCFLPGFCFNEAGFRLFFKVRQDFRNNTSWYTKNFSWFTNNLTYESPIGLSF